jgi:hypothetical protein
MGRFGYMRVQRQLAWEYSVANLVAAYEKAFSKRRRGKMVQAEKAENECSRDQLGAD